MDLNSLPSAGRAAFLCSVPIALRDLISHRQPFQYVDRTSRGWRIVYVTLSSRCFTLFCAFVSHGHGDTRTGSTAVIRPAINQCDQ